MPLSAPEYWLEWAKNYFRCQFTYVGELIHKETWSAASSGWAEGLQMINPPIYRLTTAVSDIDQTNINRYIRDGNWLSKKGSLERRSAPRVGLCSQHTLNSVLEHTMAQDALTFCIDFKPVPFTYFHKISSFWEFYQIWSKGPRFRSQKESSITCIFRILI